MIGLTSNAGRSCHHVARASPTAESCSSSTAGGHGLFLATILERYPDMTGTLFELPQVVHSLAGGPLERFKNRVRVVAGDMFTSVPAGADAYTMKRMVHDWSDEQCEKILSSCRAGVTKGGK